MKDPEQLEMPIAPERRPNNAIIFCGKRDEYVEEFVNWYSLMSLKSKVVIQDKREYIEVHLCYDDDLLDNSICIKHKD